MHGLVADLSGALVLVTAVIGLPVNSPATPGLEYWAIALFILTLAKPGWINHCPCWVAAPSNPGTGRGGKRDQKVSWTARSAPFGRGSPDRHPVGLRL